MTKKESEILIRDLSARLPYGIKAEIKYYDDAWELLAIYANGTTYAARDIGYPIETYFEDCKPYLFPLSSMTDEQKEDLSLITCDLNDSDTWRGGNIIYSDDSYQLNELLSFYHRNHLDYRGLIEMGLAIDATNKNIY